LGLLTVAAASAQVYTVVDVQNVPAAGDASSALVRITLPDRVEDVACDALVAGAGMGGIGATIALAGRGHTVCLTEETDWVGGQATAGGVPALDENRFIEMAGGTSSYRQFRAAIRDWYRQNRASAPEPRLGKI
jgi:NADPH-dependent 2,4-dienoyl-CoA reductase/sulfur reductase-like enzyme